MGRTTAVGAILNPQGLSAASMDRSLTFSWPTPDMGDASRFEYILAIGSDDSLMNRLKRLDNAETVYTGVGKSGGSNWRLEPEKVCEALQSILGI